MRGDRCRRTCMLHLRICLPHPRTMHRRHPEKCMRHLPGLWPCQRIPRTRRLRPRSRIRTRMRQHRGACEEGGEKEPVRQRLREADMQREINMTRETAVEMGMKATIKLPVVLYFLHSHPHRLRFLRFHCPPLRPRRRRRLHLLHRRLFPAAAAATAAATSVPPPPMGRGVTGHDTTVPRTHAVSTRTPRIMAGVRETPPLHRSRRRRRRQ